MFDNLPMTYAIYAGQPQLTLSGTEIILFGAAIGIVVVILMLLQAGWQAHRHNKKSKPTPQQTLEVIKQARIQCVVEFGDVLSMLDTRKLNLRRDRRALDAITLQCSAERGNLDTMPIFEDLTKAEDIFVDNYKWTRNGTGEVYKRINTLDRIIAIGEELQNRLLEQQDQDGKAQPSEVLVNLEKEMKALRNLRQMIQEDCNEMTTFLLTIKLPVHLEGDGPGVQWIKARHSGVLHRLAPKKAS